MLSLNAFSSTLNRRLSFAGHQREAGVEFGAHVVAFGGFELVDRAIEELELAHHQVLAEHEADVVVEHQRQPRDLLAGFQVLGDFVAGSSWRWHFTTAPPVDRVAQLAFVAQRQAFRQRIAGDPAGQHRARRDFGVQRQRRETAQRVAHLGDHRFGGLARRGVDRDAQPCARSSMASVRTGRTKARGSSSCTRSSFSRLRVRPPSLRPSFSSISASFFCSRSLTTAPGSSLSSPPTVSQSASSQARGDSARRRGRTATRSRAMDSSSGPTGLSAHSARWVSRSDEVERSGKAEERQVAKEHRVSMCVCVR